METESAIATADDIESVCEEEILATWEHEELAQVRIKVIRAHSDAVNSCEYVDEDTKLLTGSSDKTVKLFNVEDGQCLRTYSTGHTAIITEARTNCDLSKFVSGSWDKSIRVSSIETGQNIWSGKHEGMVMCCKFSRDGKLVASGSDLDNTLKIWEASSGKLILSIPDLHSSTITSVLFAPDDDKIITTSMDKTTQFLDLKTNKKTIKLGGHINVVSDCDITKDERKFATVSWDKNVCVWDIATGSYRSKGPSKLCASHEGCISCCRFSPDGLMLVTGSYDQNIVVWDVENEMEKVKLQGHTAWVEDVAFSQDQKWIISCSRDSTVRLWNIEDSDKIPAVLEKKKAIGVKILKCESCDRPFPAYQLEGCYDIIACVFCRFHSSQQRMIELNNVSDKSDPPV